MDHQIETSTYRFLFLLLCFCILELKALLGVDFDRVDVECRGTIEDQAEELSPEILACSEAPGQCFRAIILQGISPDPWGVGKEPNQQIVCISVLAFHRQQDFAFKEAQSSSDFAGFLHGSTSIRPPRLTRKPLTEIHLLR